MEEDKKKTDDILGDWHTPPGSPWERNANTTYGDSSLSWDTDDIAVPDSWDEGEETADNVYATANEGSTTSGDETEPSLPGLDDSLPELVSDEEETSEDSRYDFLNTPTNEEKDFEAPPEMAEENRDEQKKVKESKDFNSDSEEKQLEDSIEFILNICLLYTSPSPRDRQKSRMPSSA